MYLFLKLFSDVFFLKVKSQDMAQSGQVSFEDYFFHLDLIFGILYYVVPMTNTYTMLR